MITAEMQSEVKETAKELFAKKPDWVTFYREILGLRGIIRNTFPSREAIVAFEQTPAYEEILQWLTQLRQQGPLEASEEEPTRMITVRLPKSMHESLRVEALERGTSINKLCISKLLQYIDNDKVPTEA